MKKYRTSLIITGIIVMIMLFVWTYYSYKHSESFFSISFSGVITVSMNAFILLFITLYFNQANNDSQKRKEILRSVLVQLQDKFYAIAPANAVDKEHILTENRHLNNLIRILEERSDEFNIKSEIGFIRQRFDEYKDLMESHINDTDYLHKSQKEINRPIELIHPKIIEAMLNLYQ
jgi:hypothetical protein